MNPNAKARPRYAMPGFAIWLAWSAASAASAAAAPAVGEGGGVPVVSLAVYPERVTLHHRTDSQRLVAVATRRDGVTIDVTDRVAWSIDGDPADNGAVTFAAGVVRATRNGMGRVVAELPAEAGLSTLASEAEVVRAECDVQAVSIETERAVSYRHDVIPVFLRAGCNSGGCHGSSRGKDGFGLSLFGFDPSGDHRRLTREMIGRRINLALPAESLLLTKSIAAAPHTGGKRFDHDSVYYDKLKQWIEAGAPNDVAGAAAVSAIRLYPPKAALESGGAQQRFVVVADYSDGTTRDVTHLALFLSSNDGSAEIDPDGLVTSGRRGEAFVMARFDTHTVGSQVLSLPAGGGFTPSDEAPANYIDALVTKKLDTMRVAPSGRCSDEEFLRRVTIDIVGRLPTPAERSAFLAEGNPAKRAVKIDQLLERPEFSDLWAAKWADLLLVRTELNRVDYKPMFLYAEWLREQVASGAPLDEMVHAILSAEGSTFRSPATNFYQVEPDANKVAENAAQSLLGLRLQCAQCHNHPFDRWTMDDYYAFTAFFAQVGRKRAEDYREYIVFDRRRGEARHPVGDRVMPPRFLGGEQPETAGVDRRKVLADWITSPENPYFAVSVANRVWAHFFGIGVVEPVDDIRVSNPPSNPELFERLGEKLVGYRYDTRRLIRDLCNSNTYQRSSQPNDSNRDDTRNFARCVPRRLPASTLLDCLGQVTGSPGKLPGVPLGASANRIADGRARHYFLDTFGRARRDSVCACESDTQPTLSQALHLINGAATNNKIQGGGLVKHWLAEGATPEEVIERVYLRCLTRRPTPEERDGYAGLIAGAEAPRQALEDVFWAVLNSREFLFNH